ncbi:response regulator [Eisenibacter elegans]|uniref:response regulator n=1 Tax=Eisenibacter elegans TaxID=997 RepID=UPI0003FAF4F3|nr:response regulator [Eisenibacter elegans]
MGQTQKAILCVDDEIIILDSLKTQLRNILGTQFIIEGAESAEEALEVVAFLSTRKIDTLLIISDWLMPGMKGDELLIQIRKKHPKIAVMMLSGQADQKAIDKAKKHADLQVFMTKPWEEQELARCVKQLLAL